jgi:opacity protein-like surface antigen
MMRLLVVLLLGLPLLGQQIPRADVFGTIGYAKLYDDEGRLGNGAAVGGGIGYRLRKRLGVEAEINGFSTEREIAAGFPPFRNSGAFLMGNALAHFGPPRAQFYLLGGAGVANVRNRISGFSESGFGINFGFGMKIFASEHIYVRPDFRIYGKTGGEPYSLMRIGIGVGYSW